MQTLTNIVPQECQLGLDENGSDERLGNRSLEDIRSDFPGLGQQVHGAPLVYLDNAASTQAPRAVIRAMDHYYSHDRANIHRGIHTLSTRATEAYEEARKRTAAFIGAEHADEIVFVRGTTEAINLVAQSWGQKNLGPGDRVLLTAMEHHSNIVPWQLIREQAGFSIDVVPVPARGELDMEAFESLLSPQTKLVAVVHVSNTLGTVNPISKITAMAHEVGAKVLVDGAQTVPHASVHVGELACDFYAFSGHKLYGPNGIGVLYGRQELLQKMPPYQGGGGMIDTVSFDNTTWAEPPERFEAGTPNVSGALGLAAAMDYVEAIGWSAIAQHETDLLTYAHERLKEVPGLRVIGTADFKAAVVSFVMDELHPSDLGTLLDQMGIAIRTGHHCTQPLMQVLGLPATARASFGLYNSRTEVDRLVEGLHQARKIFAL